MDSVEQAVIGAVKGFTSIKEATVRYTTAEIV
jgi:hypothetical protein